MRKKLIAVLCFLAFVVSSCEKNTIKSVISDSDYLIFGHFYGECLGKHCVQIYKLESDKLLEDDLDKYPNSTGFYEGKFVQLSNDKFNIVKGLMNDFPKELLKESNVRVGEPDAGDWGGLYIEYNVGGVRKFWLLDKNKNNVPAKYHAFIEKVNQKIRLLQ
jgi:hypothetical protein